MAKSRRLCRYLVTPLLLIACRFDLPPSLPPMDATFDAFAQQAYIKASNTDKEDSFGLSVALSADGSVLAVGAYLEDSAATSVGGDQSDNSMPDAGAVFVFTRSEETWLQHAYVKASNTAVGDHFGHAVALSGDGSTLAVGACGEDSMATGINGDQMDNSSSATGAVYVFIRSGPSWIQQAYVKASNTGLIDQFACHAIALSYDGSTLAIGAHSEDSIATGIGGDQTDNSASNAGAVYVFARTGGTWNQQAYVKASNTDAGDLFGSSVALSGDGSTLAVGAPDEASAATGLTGNQVDNSAIGAGAAYVFTRSGAAWIQRNYLKASNTDAGDNFGASVALSSNGSTLAVGAYREAGAAPGVADGQLDNSTLNAGAVYVFVRDNTTWIQQAYVKASNAGENDKFGVSIALAGDGSVLVVGADGEASATTGVDGNQVDNSAMNTGAAYVFARCDMVWNPQSYIKAATTAAEDKFGLNVALAADSLTFAAGADGEDSSAIGIDGDQADNSASASGAVYLFRRARQ